MRYNQLGNTGLFVSEICLGTMTFSEAGSGPTSGAIAGVDQKAADQIVESSIAAGVNFIDTADVYWFGESERLLGQALKNLDVPRKDVVLATKVSREMGDKPNDRGASRGHIMDSVEASLKRLQTDHIDLYQIHATDTVTPIDETLRAFDDLISRGLVRYIGVSNWQAWRIAKALGISERRGFARFETVQAYYSIAGRDLERDIVPLMNEAEPRELLISTEQDHRGVLVAVRDSGPGLDPPHLERVFDAFYTTKSSGMGMGLSICRSIIEAHGGRLWAEANEPRGAVFQFTLPAVP
jgi:aryl-alcohol dehydrogenase-like predicted oxidoreductase